MTHPVYYSVTSLAATSGVVAVNVPAEGSVRGLDAATGQLRWQTRVGARILGWAPLAQAGVVYVAGSGPDTLTALQAGTGQVLWSTPISGATSAVPVLVDGAVDLATDDLYAVDAASGALRWTVPVTDTSADLRSTNGSPAVDASNVYVAGRDGTVRAYDTTTGASRWTSSIGTSSLTDAAVIDGMVVAVNGAGQLHGLDAATGTDRWTAQVDSGDFSPAVTAGRVVIGGQGRVQVLASADGSLLDTIPETGGCDVDQPPLPLPLSHTVYFAGCRLHASPLQ